MRFFIAQIEMAYHRHLDSAVAVLVVFNEVHVFVDIANHIGAETSSREKRTAAFHAVIFPPKEPVSSTESGFKDTLSMPCCISHLAKSG